MAPTPTVANPICYQHKNEKSVSCYRYEPAFIHASNASTPVLTQGGRDGHPQSMLQGYGDVKGDAVDAQTMWVCTDSHEGVNNHMYIIYQDYLQMRPYVADGWCPKTETFCAGDNLIEITLDKTFAGGDDLKGWYCYESLTGPDPTIYKSGFSPCGGKGPAYEMSWDSPRLEDIKETALFNYTVQTQLECHPAVTNHELLAQSQEFHPLDCAQLCNDESDCAFFEYVPGTDEAPCARCLPTKMPRESIPTIATPQKTHTPT